MDARAALITGGSSGIGLAIARVLGQDGYSITLSARRPDKLEAAAETLRGDAIDVIPFAANMANEEDIKALAQAHRDRYGRLDVLVNNAGIGIGSTIAETDTKKLDLQLDVNLRAVYLMTREVVDLLKAAGHEHHKALIVNTASIAGKRAEAWLSAYSATKFGVVGLSQAMHKEFAEEGIQVTALCPAFVATPMTDWVEEHVSKDEMIQPEDIAGAVRYLLSTSPWCMIPEIQFLRAGDTAGGP
jgi:NAD(P)-dependent dehydrogenase (short-subunit alcohol dehydrogenase family)